jgi:N-formylglutamate amidohydrolase
VPPADPRSPWSCEDRQRAVIATAIHNGHDVRDEVAALLAIDDACRLHEEDPYTGAWADTIDASSVVVHRSRFEVDLNRPRDGAVYRRPEDAWGLRVWRADLPDDVVARSLSLYDEFYETLDALLSNAAREHGRFVVLDLHSYNHRRGGAAADPDDPAGNPEVNLGTGSLDRATWGHVADRFMAELRAVDVMGRHLDVRADVRFRGGHLSRWVNETFPGVGCALAIEVKKLFMDEHTGELDREVHAALGNALAAIVPGLLDELGMR